MKHHTLHVHHEDCTRKVSSHAIPFFLLFGVAIATNAEPPTEILCQSDSDCSRVLPQRTMCVHGEDVSLTHRICEQPSDANIMRIFRRGPQTSPDFPSSTRGTQVLAAQKKSGKNKSKKSPKNHPTATITTRNSAPSSLPMRNDDSLDKAANVGTKPSAAANRQTTSAKPGETAQASIGSAVEFPVSHTDGMWIGIVVSAVIAFVAMGVIFAFTRRVRRVRNAENLKQKGRYDESPAGFESFAKPGGKMEGASRIPSNASVFSYDSMRLDRSFGNMSSTSSVTVKNPVFNATNSGTNRPLRDSSSSRSNNSMLSSKSRIGHRIPGTGQLPAIANNVWIPAREHRRPGTPISKSKSQFHPSKSHSLASSYASSSSGSSQATASLANVSLESSTSYQTRVSTNPPSSLAAPPFLLTEADRVAIAERNKVRMFLHGPK